MTHVINNILIGLNNLGRVFCNYAASVFIQSALLVILLLVVDLLLRKRVRAIFRYCLWLLVLVKLILPPMLSFPTGIGYWVGGHLPAAFPTSNGAFDVAGLERASPSAEMPQVRPAQNITEIDALTAPADSVLTSLTWQAVLFILWLVGVLAFLVMLVQRVRFVRGLIAASNPAKEELLGLLEQCRRQIGVRWDIRLRVSETIPSPAVCGFFRPTVLIPTPLVERLSTEGLRATLIHELAHIKRGDLWVNSVQTFLQVIYFYNPFVWFANSIIRRICEEAVDETVLVVLEGQAKNYSNTLIDIGEMAFWRADLGLRLVGVAESKKALKWRIKHMLTRPIPKSSKLGALGIIVIFTIAAALLPMARAQKTGEKSEPISGENQVESTKSLHQAVADGDIEQVKLLISRGADVNERGVWGNTPLHYASMRGHAEVAELLISLGAYVNAPDGRNAMTPLHCAAASGNKQTVELLLSKGADINTKNRAGRTPLFEAMKSPEAGRKEIVEILVAKGAKVPAMHLAAYMGDIEKVRKCLQDGIDINSQENFCCTALHAATNGGKKNVTEFLIGRGANIDERDTSGMTPLYYAAIHNCEDIVDLLLSKGADVNAKHEYNFVLLNYAIWDGSKDAIKLLISKGANVNVKDDDGFTLLIWAIWWSDKDMVELLISNGADVDTEEDSYGCTALYWAAVQGSKDLVELLIAKGAAPLSAIHSAACAGDLAKVKSLVKEGTDVNTKGKSSGDETPLFAAVFADHNDVAKFLIAKGADVNAKDKSGQTPLHSACEHGKRNMVELLITEGADVNAKDNGGHTSLHRMFFSGRARTDIAELLIAKGANVNAKLTSSLTPLHYAVESGYTKIVGLFIAKGADVNAKDNEGETPLHEACKLGYKQMVELLIAKGADMNAKDNRQRTALSSAKELGHEEIVELLRKHGAKE